MKASRRLAFLVFALDAAIILVANWLALLGRANLAIFPEANDTAMLVQPIATLIVIAWLGTLIASDSYNTERLGLGFTEYKAVLSASASVGSLVAIVAFLFKYPLSSGYYLLLFSSGTLLLLVGRYFLRRALHWARRKGHLGANVLLVGNPSNIDELTKVLRRESWLGYAPVGALTYNRAGVTSDDLPVVGEPSDLLRCVRETKASVVLFVEGAFPRSADFRRAAWDLEDSHVQMVVVPALTDVSAQRLEVRPTAGLPLVYLEPPQALAAARGLKRFFDLCGVVLSAVYAIPVLVIAAIAIKLDDGGPVLFTQTRVGRHGRPFTCYKLRSMKVNAEAELATLTTRNQQDGPMFKIADDPRITRVGRFLRRYSIDELPQLWNVARGHMSLIGPRPALPQEVAAYNDDVRRRLHVRPGMTGLWQVSGRSDLSWEDTVRLDLYYVDNWSILQDLAILGRTFGAVFRSRGAY